MAYGHYWAETKPVLTINSGDIIDVDTLLTSTPARLEQSGVAAADVQASLRAIVDTVKDRGPGGHILTGPVFVTGAEPGDALEVKVLSIDLPIAYGYNGCSGFVRENCEPGRGQTIIPLDRKNMTATFLPGVVIPLRPFFGSMGVAPPLEVGRVSSNPPSTHAGNLDNKELVAGTTLFIPVHVRGALFEVGDGHAAQGDGEVDQTGIETSLRGRLQLTVRKGMKLAWPRAETDLYYISMGTDVDLTKATRVAIQEMIDFLAATKKMDKHQAYQLTSLAGDVAITQLVDGTMGVHVKMPKSSSRYQIVQHDGSMGSRVRLVHGMAWWRSAVACSPRRRATCCRRSRKKPADAQHAGITTPHGDHSPHHGGIVMMNGEMHYEVVFDKAGKHRVWFSDAVREDLPASVAGSVVMIVTRPMGAAETLALAIDDSGESWVAAGAPLDESGTTVTLRYSVRGEPFEIEIPFLPR